MSVFWFHKYTIANISHLVGNIVVHLSSIPSAITITDNVPESLVGNCFLLPVEPLANLFEKRATSNQETGKGKKEEITSQTGLVGCFFLYILFFFGCCCLFFSLLIYNLLYKCIKSLFVFSCISCNFGFHHFKNISLLTCIIGFIFFWFLVSYS